MRSRDFVLKANVAENKAQKPKSEFKTRRRLIWDIAYTVSNCVALHFQHRPWHMQNAPNRNVSFCTFATWLINLVTARFDDLMPLSPLLTKKR